MLKALKILKNIKYWPAFNIQEAIDEIENIESIHVRFKNGMGIILTKKQGPIIQGELDDTIVCKNLPVRT